MRVVLQFMNKRWTRFKKEVITAIYSAILYHAWKVRNWKIHRGITVNIIFIVTQIKLEIKERIEMLQSSKKADRCRNFLQAIV